MNNLLNTLLNNLLVSMTITGSIPFLLYYLLKKTPIYLRASKLQILLLLSLTFFIFPIPLLSAQLKILYRSIFQDKNIFWDTFLPDEVRIFSVNNEIVFWNQPDISYLVITSIWLIGFLAMFSFRIFQYILMRKTIKKYYTYVDSYYISYRFFRRKIRIYQNNMTSPFSTGFLHPIIVLPENLSSKEKFYIILHEETHIRRFDFMFCFLAIFAQCIHWFNPIAYVLLNNIKSNQEYTIDETVFKTLKEPALQKEYGQLVFDSSCWNYNITPHNKHVLSLNNREFKIFRERIRRLKNMEHKKKSKSCIIMVTIILAIIANMFPLLVYSAPQRATGNVSVDNSSFIFKSNSVENSEPSFNLSDTYFVYETGERIPVFPENLETNSRASCNHKWEYGTIQKHFKYSDGSCDIKIYNARRCKECASIEILSLNNKIHFDICTH